VRKLERESQKDEGRARRLRSPRIVGIGPRSLTFLIAVGALIASILILLAAGESEWPMFVLALGGLLAGRVWGVGERHLAVIAFGVIALAWPFALFTSPVPRATSTLAHIAVAALLAWVLAGPVRQRWAPAVARPWSPRWFLIPLLVLSIGAVWELGEWLGDAIFGTDLSVQPFDTVTDLAADLAGAIVGLAIYDRALAGTRRKEPELDGAHAETAIGTER